MQIVIVVQLVFFNLLNILGPVRQSIIISSVKLGLCVLLFIFTFEYPVILTKSSTGIKWIEAEWKEKG